MKNLFLLLLFVLSLGSSYSQESLDPELFSPKGIAAIYIDLEDGKNPEDISKTQKLTARMRIVNANNSVYTSDELYDGLIKIKGRGNTTWTFFPKKPYNIDLIDAEGEDNVSGLLGMPADEEWSLIANYADKSLLRIPLAYNLGRLMGMEYSPRLRFVEVFVNNRYDGLYCLCEKIKRSKERVNIKKLDKKSSIDQISGGYLIEVTPVGRFDPTDSTFVSSIAGLGFTIKYPKAKNIAKEQVDWIRDYVNQIDTILYKGDYKDPESGFRKYIEENSIIDWYLVNELGKNVDAAMHASVFFYKDRDDKLKAGPLWDFDIAFGNINYNSAWLEDGLYISNSAWFNKMFTDEVFVKKTRDRYEELKPLFDRIPEILQKNAQQMIDCGAIDRNFERWPILGEYVWPNKAPYPLVYEGELQRLANWVEARNSWLNVNMCLSDEESCAVLSVEKIPLRADDTDKFSEGDTTYIKAVRGYDKYIWNDVIETRFSDIKSSKGGKYWVRAQKGTSCLSAVSDTLIFIAKGKIDYQDSNALFEYDGTSKTRSFVTIPEGLNTNTIFELESELSDGESEPLTEIILPGSYVMKTSINEAYYKGEGLSVVKILGAVIAKDEVIISLEDEHALSHDVETGSEHIGWTWTSSSPDVVEVDSDGVLYARSIGEANITLKTNDEKFSSSCLVKVDFGQGMSDANWASETSFSVNDGSVLVRFAESGEYTLTVSDITGKIMYKGTVKGESHEINTRDYSAGVYVLTVENSQYKKSEKVIIK